MKNEKSKKIGIIGMALTYSGSILGAGYVSGQELFQYFGVYGIILCVAAWTGAVGILVLWIKSQLRNFWIFISCGLTRVRNILWLGSEILIITAFGKILSLLSYYLLEDFWKSFNVSPAGFGISPVLSFLTLFLASILIAAITSLRLEKSIHNYE